MRIKELLEAADKSNEQPEQDSVDDFDIDTTEFKQYAGKLSSDLYSITMYDYSNEFSSIGPNSVVESILEQFEQDPAVADYLSLDNDAIASDKIISAVILNDRNGRFVSYAAGVELSQFSPSNVAQLITSGVIDSDQAEVLQRIERAGNNYSNAVTDTNWRAGQEAQDSDVYDAMDGLTSALRLPDLPMPRRIPRDDELSDEQRAFNQRVFGGMEQEMLRRIEQMKKNKEKQKKAGAGRKKR